MPSHRHVPLRAAQVGRDAAAANVRVRRAIVPEWFIAGTASSAIVGCELGRSFFFTCPPRVSSSTPFFAPTGDACGPHFHARHFLHRSHRPRGERVTLSCLSLPRALIPAPLGRRVATATVPTQYTNDSKPWPIQIEDHEGTLHSVNLEPGQVRVRPHVHGGWRPAAVSGGRWLVASGRPPENRPRGKLSRRRPCASLVLALTIGFVSARPDRCCSTRAPSACTGACRSSTASTTAGTP